MDIAYLVGRGKARAQVGTGVQGPGVNQAPLQRGTLRIYTRCGRSGPPGQGPRRGDGEVPAYARRSELEQRAAAKSGRSHMVELNHLVLVIPTRCQEQICPVSRDTLPAGRDQKQVICDDGEPDVYIRFERVFIDGRPDRATSFFFHSQVCDATQGMWGGP